MYSHNYDDVWQSISGFADAWGEEGRPIPEQLVTQFKSTVYGLVELISNKIQEIFEKHATVVMAGNSKKYKIKSLNSKIAIPLQYRRKSTDFNEVVEHPFLDLMDNPNPYQTFSEIVGQIAAFKLLTGNAYNRKVFNKLNPKKIDHLLVIPSQVVKMVKDERGYVGHYEIQNGLGFGEETLEIPAPEIIHHTLFSPYDNIYNESSDSPVMAIWLELMTQFKEISSWDALITNQSSPSVVVSPKDKDAVFSPENQERLTKQIEDRYSKGGKGGPLFANGAVDVQPFNLAPKDMAGLQLYDLIYKIATRVFGIPSSYQDMGETSYAAAEVMELQFQKNCIKPLLSKIVTTLNKELVQKFDSRMFIVVDHYEMKDKAFELQVNQARVANNVAYVNAQIKTPNEVRKEEGLPPLAGGDTFPEKTTTQPGISGQTDFVGGAGAKSIRKKKATTIDLIIIKLQDIFAQQHKDVLDSLKILKSAKTRKKSLADFDTGNMAKELLPLFQKLYEEASAQLAGKLKLDKVVGDNLKAACDKLVLNFCESTNNSTSMNLNKALDEVRAGLSEGMDKGEVYKELTKRVNAIFEDLSVNRAYNIAVSESTRSRHDSELITIKENGLENEVKKRWLAKSNACPQCLALNGKTIHIDEPFEITNAKNPAYRVIMAPPAHSGGCTCSLSYELD